MSFYSLLNFIFITVLTNPSKGLVELIVLKTFQAFQKRYFVLKGNLLFYFERKTDREPIGVIILEGCTIELAEDDQER